MKKIITYIITALLTFLCLTVQASTKPVVIDTDASTDDAIALLYLLHISDIDIKAIIIDRNGGSSPNTAGGHIGYLLKMANKSQIPVYMGLEKKAVYHNVYPTWLDNLVDKSFGNHSVPPTQVINKNELVTLIQSQPQPIYLLSLGSLTNIADLLQQYPGIKTKIAGITIMGGAIDTAGNIPVLQPKNKNSYAEWNVYVDPVAFEQVLQSQLPITLVSLDITNNVPVTMTFMNQLKQQQTTAASQFVYQLLEQNMYWIEHNQYDFWDPLAAYVLAHPEQVTVEQKRIQTVLTHNTHFGQLTDTPDGYPVHMVKKLDPNVFESSLLTALGQRS
ncbi:MAG: nucleoside hydrolase [Gammaproteobacteria bacterium]